MGLYQSSISHQIAQPVVLCSTELIPSETSQFSYHKIKRLHHPDKEALERDLTNVIYSM